MFVHDWKELFENPDIGGLLQKWLDKLAPYYEEGSVLRQRSLERLNMKYWLDQVEHKYQHYIEGQIMEVHRHNKNVTNASLNKSEGSSSGLPRRLAIESYD